MLVTTIYLVFRIVSCVSASDHSGTLAKYTWYNDLDNTDMYTYILTHGCPHRDWLRSLIRDIINASYALVIGTPGIGPRYLLRYTLLFTGKCAYKSYTLANVACILSLIVVICFIRRQIHPIQNQAENLTLSAFISTRFDHFQDPHCIWPSQSAAMFRPVKFRQFWVNYFFNVTWLLDGHHVSLGVLHIAFDARLVDKEGVIQDHELIVLDAEYEGLEQK